MEAVSTGQMTNCSNGGKNSRRVDRPEEEEDDDDICGDNFWRKGFYRPRYLRHDNCNDSGCNKWRTFGRRESFALTKGGPCGFSRNLNGPRTDVVVWRVYTYAQ